MSAVGGGAEQEPIRVSLPGGWWAGAARSPQREVALRPVSGEDEAFLLETIDLDLPCRRASALLARCVVDPPDGASVVAGLTVGDYEALLLELRRLTLGEQLDCIVRCPAEGCEESMELELHVSDLLVAPYAGVRRRHKLEFRADGADYAVVFRLPTSSDVCAVATLAARDPEGAALALLGRCVLSAARNRSAVLESALPSAARDAIAHSMAERDPQAELVLDMTCPECGAAFTVIFDTASFFLQELDARAVQLLRDVHALARYYAWSEHEILRIPAARREMYLELIAEGVAASRAG